MRPATEVLLRWARDGNRPDLCEQGGDDVHDDAARVDRTTARDIEADPIDGNPALGDRATGCHRRGRLGAALLGVHQAGPADGLLECPADLRVEVHESLGDDLGRHAQGRRAHAVKALRGVEDGRATAGGDVVADRTDSSQGCLDIQLGTRQGAPELAEGGRASAKVENGDHESQSR